MKSNGNNHAGGNQSKQFLLQQSETMRQALHDLQVHQIELELQNEELRLTQLQLDKVRQRYFDLYDMAPVGYCTVSEKGLILEANITAATLLGVVRGELVGKRISQFIDKADQDAFYIHRNQLFVTDESQTCDLQLIKGDGATFWANLVTTATKNDCLETVLRIAISDITVRKNLEALLKHKNVELECAILVAEKASLAKSDFLSSMSHELRSPLNAILGFAQLIESGHPEPTPSQKRSTDQILHAGWHLLDLINEILDLAMIESGKLSLLLEPISLIKVMHECENMSELQAENRGIHVTFPQEDLPYFVSADRIRLKQILINLLSNAIKYNKASGTVDVYCSMKNAGRIRISVKDTGDGLSPEKISGLFQPFNRLGQESSTTEGTGIGLVVCKRLVELMAGVIGVDSIVGEGSVFWIELNVTEEAKASRVTGIAAAGTALTASPLQQYTLLYIEDNPANLMLVEDIIARRQDVTLLTAIDGKSGIEMARNSLPDVILMDINLPGLSGIEVLKILHEDPATAHIPVLAISANAMPHDIQRGVQAGFFDYITKPLKVNEFINTMDTSLQFARSRLSVR